MVGTRWRGLRLLHLCLLGSLVVYGVVAVVVTKPKTPPIGLGVLLYVFASVALIELLVAIPLVRAKHMPPRERVGDGRDLDLATPLEGRLATAFVRLTQASLLTWALCTSVAIYGLVLAFLWGDPRLYAAFAVPAALAMIVWAPSRTLIEEVVRAARRDG